MSNIGRPVKITSSTDAEIVGLSGTVVSEDAGGRMMVRNNDPDHVYVVFTVSPRLDGLEWLDDGETTEESGYHIA